MRIIFDVEPLQNPDYKDRGIGRYVRNLLQAYADRGQVLHLTYNPDLPPPDLGKLRFHANVFPATRMNFFGNPATWLITTSPFEKSFGSTAEIYRNANPLAKVATIWYDSIPLVFENEYLSSSIERFKYAANLQSCKKSDLILPISEHSTKDYLRYVDETAHVATIGTGVDEFFSHPTRLLMLI